MDNDASRRRFSTLWIDGSRGHFDGLLLNSSCFDQARNGRLIRIRALERNKGRKSINVH
jgi:hypothetical protein